MAAIIVRMCFTPLRLCAVSPDRDRLRFGQSTLVQFEPTAEHQHTALFMCRSSAGDGMAALACRRARSRRPAPRRGAAAIADAAGLRTGQGSPQTGAVCYDFASARL